MNTFIDGDLFLRDGDYYGGTLKVEWFREYDEVSWALRWNAYEGGGANLKLGHKEALQLADKIYEEVGKDLDEAQRNRIKIAEQEARIRTLETYVRNSQNRSIKMEAAIRVALREMDAEKIKIYLDRILNEEWS